VRVLKEKKRSFSKGLGKQKATPSSLFHVWRE